MEILFKKIVGLVNYYVPVNCYALGPTGQYSILIFRIPTVFDIIPLELVRFSKFLIFRKFVFVFVSGFTAFIFV